MRNSHAVKQPQFAQKSGFSVPLGPILAKSGYVDYVTREEGLSTENLYLARGAA